MTYRPSSETFTHVNSRACPLSVRTSLPVRASQSLAVLSWLPVRTRWPSGKKATEATGAVCPASGGSSGLRVSTSHTRAVLSSLPVTIFLPSTEKTALMTADLCPSKLSPTCSPVSVDQSRAVLSFEAVKICWPLRENTADRTWSVCPLSVRSSFPDSASHRLAVLSLLEVRISMPSGEYTAVLTAPVCPSSFMSDTPVLASQTRAAMSELPVTMRVALGENPAAATIPLGLKLMSSLTFWRSQRVASLPPTLRIDSPSGEKAALDNWTPRLLLKSRNGPDFPVSFGNTISRRPSRSHKRTTFSITSSVVSVFRVSSD